MSTGRVTQALHLQEADLIKTPSKNVNDMAIVSGALGKVVIELIDQINVLSTRNGGLKLTLSAFL